MRIMRNLARTTSGAGSHAVGPSGKDSTAPVRAGHGHLGRPSSPHTSRPNLGKDHRSPCSVVAALVPLAHQTAKRSHPVTDAASTCTGASSKSKPDGKRVLALAAVRHQKSSSLISLSSRKRDPASKGQKNPGQAPGDRSRKFNNPRSQARRSKPSDLFGSSLVRSMVRRQFATHGVPNYRVAPLMRAQSEYRKSGCLH